MSADGAAATVLVVDDDAVNRDLLRRRLAMLGHEAAEAAGGAEALAYAAANPPDAVLLDLTMPDMDGYEVLARFKADPALADIPVIMVSAVSDSRAAIRCIEAGAEDLLPKPFNATVLKARLGASLEKKRLRDRERERFAETAENLRRLQELESLRDDLTRMIVHDLRTPLAAITGAVGLIEVAGGVNDAQREFLRQAHRAAGVMNGMIGDLLDISRMESGALALERRPVAPAALVRAAAEEVAYPAADKGLDVLAEAAGDAPAVPGDEERLRRVLVNLLGNAVKFTPRGGSLGVVARPEPRAPGCPPACGFTVWDTGPGVPMEARERIFEKFAQVAQAGSGGPNGNGRTFGAGLGLAFCKMMVEAHGGRLWVEDGPNGVGSAFRFYLPAG